MDKMKEIFKYLFGNYLHINRYWQIAFIDSIKYFLPQMGF